MKVQTTKAVPTIPSKPNSGTALFYVRFLSYGSEKGALWQNHNAPFLFFNKQPLQPVHNLVELLAKSDSVAL